MQIARFSYTNLKELFLWCSIITITYPITSKIFPTGLPIFPFLILCMLLIATILFFKDRSFSFLYDFFNSAKKSKNLFFYTSSILLLSTHYLVLFVFTSNKFSVAKSDVVNIIEILFILFLVIYLLCFFSIDEIKKRLTTFIAITVGIGSFTSLIRFYYFYSNFKDPTLSFYKFETTTSMIKDYNLYSLALLGGCIALLNFCKHSKRKATFVLANLSLIAVYFNLYFTSSRRGILILLILLCYHFFTLFIRYLKTKKITFLLVAISSLLIMGNTQYFINGYFKYLTSQDKEYFSKVLNLNHEKVAHNFSHIYWRHLLLVNKNADINEVRRSFKSYNPPKSKSSQWFYTQYDTITSTLVFIFNLTDKINSNDRLEITEEVFLGIETMSPETSSRKQRFMYSLELFGEYSIIKKLFGNGFEYLSQYGEKFNSSKSHTYGYPHNILLSSLLYSGLIGSFILCFFIWVSCWKIFHSYKASPFTIFYLVAILYYMTSFNSVFSSKLLLMLLLYPILETYIKESGKYEI